MAVNVEFDCRIHSDHTQTSCYFGTVGYFQRAQDDFGTVFIKVAVEAFEC